ncbi:hypothetical protein Pcinc_015427 [Petrolisthes cinctipes]|uniref:Uncharacterized protein n=1 Tax=Petrolisthes cinctipes TaxID=88211 RepID=A0AAE1FUV8_PETCI|nr:hypothetical protein Pcinc_015427 [Petrolisthes cinctipes]
MRCLHSTRYISKPVHQHQPTLLSRTSPTTTITTTNTTSTITITSGILCELEDLVEDFPQYRFRALRRLVYDRSARPSMCLVQRRCTDSNNRRSPKYPVFQTVDPNSNIGLYGYLPGINQSYPGGSAEENPQQSSQQSHAGIKIRDPVKKTTTNTYVPQFINEDGVTNNVEGFTEVKQNNINHTAQVKPRGHVVIYQQELIVDRSALTEPKLISR